MKYSSQYIFIIHSSAWQFLTVQEYLAQMNLRSGDVSVLIFVEEDSSSELQLREINKILNIKSEFITYKKSFIGKIRRYLKISKLSLKCEDLFIPQLKIRWLDFLISRSNYNHISLFDEGTHTLEVIKKIQAGDKSIPYSFHKVFTQYLEDQILVDGTKIINNKLDFLKSNIQELVIAEENWFVGQPLYKEDILEEDQLLFLEKIIKINENFLYIPHRYESVEFIAKVRKLGFNILKSKSIIEFLPMELSRLPRQIFGFTSSSLITFKRLLPKEVKIYSVRIPESKILQGRKDRMNLFYETILKQNVLLWSESE